jgi:hypothetical protein
MAAVEGWRLGFGDTLVFAQALLFGIGICHGGFADVIELLAPGRLILGIGVFQVIGYCSNERAIAAIALVVNRSKSTRS